MPARPNIYLLTISTIYCNYRTSFWLHLQENFDSLFCCIRGQQHTKTQLHPISNQLTKSFTSHRRDTEKWGIEHKVAWAEAYLHTKWHFNVSSRLATINMGRKFGGLAIFGSGGWAGLTVQPFGHGAVT